jgi:antitoxin VapB
MYGHVAECLIGMRSVILEIHAPKADELARELADATGEDIDTAVLRAIEERLARTPRRSGGAERAEIEALFDRLTRLPVLDRRTLDEIVGYDSDGLPI